MHMDLEKQYGHGIKLLQEIIDYIEKNLLDELTLDRVASHFYISSTLMNQLFRSVFDMTTMEYIRCRRLSLAGNDLLTSNIHIIDAAFKYGYETPEAFSKAFTRFHGFPPSLVRRIYPQIKVFNPLQIKIEIHGGLSEKITADEIPLLTKLGASEQESYLGYCYNDSTNIRGGYSMEHQNCKFHINTNDMKQKEDWDILLLLIIKLKEAGITFKVDGKTMIFAHGLEFKLDKICLTFKWKEEQKVLDFFNEEGEFLETYPGFKYYDTNFSGMKVRCMLYGEFPGSDSDEVLYQNTDLVEVNGVIFHVQSLEFYYENAEPGNKYYKMVEDYIQNNNYARSKERNGNLNGD
jgi:AraC-like DNA-binding protein